MRVNGQLERRTEAASSFTPEFEALRESFLPEARRAYLDDTAPARSALPLDASLTRAAKDRALIDKVKHMTDEQLQSLSPKEAARLLAAVTNLVERHEVDQYYLPAIAPQKEEIFRLALRLTKNIDDDIEFRSWNWKKSTDLAAALRQDRELQALEVKMQAAPAGGEYAALAQQYAQRVADHYACAYGMPPIAVQPRGAGFSEILRDPPRLRFDPSSTHGPKDVMRLTLDAANRLMLTSDIPFSSGPNPLVRGKQQLDRLLAKPTGLLILRRGSDFGDALDQRYCVAGAQTWSRQVTNDVFRPADQDRMDAELIKKLQKVSDDQLRALPPDHALALLGAISTMIAQHGVDKYDLNEKSSKLKEEIFYQALRLTSLIGEEKKYREWDAQRQKQLATVIKCDDKLTALAKQLADMPPTDTIPKGSELAKQYAALAQEYADGVAKHFAALHGMPPIKVTVNPASNLWGGAFVAERRFEINPFLARTGPEDLFKVIAHESNHIFQGDVAANRIAGIPAAEVPIVRAKLLVDKQLSTPWWSLYKTDREEWGRIWGMRFIELDSQRAERDLTTNMKKVRES